MSIKSSPYFNAGLICLILGLILFLFSFFMNTSTPSQKNNQNLVFWSGLILIFVGGGILSYLFFKNNNNDSSFVVVNEETNQITAGYKRRK